MRRSTALLVAGLALSLPVLGVMTDGARPTGGAVTGTAPQPPATGTGSAASGGRVAQLTAVARPVFVPPAAREVRAASHAIATSLRPGTLFLGDSVMLGARPWLRRLPGRVDAVESRQVYAGLSIVRRLARSGRLPGTVVVHLGTNGQFPSYACGDLRRAVGPRGRLLLVTVRVPRSWTAADNRAITTCARRYRNVGLVPWRAYSGRHPAVFAADGYHLSPRGGRAYAHLVRMSL